MKLFELLYSDRVEALHKAAKTDPTKHVKGAGTMAFVYQHNDDHQLDRVERISLSADPHTAFMQFIIDNNVKNPYLPRCFGKSDSNGIVQSTMERLVPFANPNVATVELVRNLCGKWFQYHISHPLETQMDENTTQFECAEYISNIIHDAITSDPDDLIQDPVLLEAIKIIRIVMKSSRSFVADITSENIMWRIAGGVPHLVITDPINTTGAYA